MLITNINYKCDLCIKNNQNQIDTLIKNVLRNIGHK